MNGRHSPLMPSGYALSLVQRSRIRIQLHLATPRTVKTRKSDELPTRNHFPIIQHWFGIQNILGPWIDRRAVDCVRPSAVICHGWRQHYSDCYTWRGHSYINIVYLLMWPQIGYLVSYISQATAYRILTASVIRFMRDVSSDG